MVKQFNYIIAHQWSSGALGTYAYGSEVQFGTKNDAETLLEYVRIKCPERDWKIYKILDT